MSSTPRTDSIRKRFAGKKVSSTECAELYEHASELELDLAYAKEQRDALAEALEIIASGGRGQFRWSMTKAEWLARKALAAVKGGEG